MRQAGGWSPLHVACHHGRTDVVQLLLNKGATVNAVDVCCVLSGSSMAIVLEMIVRPSCGVCQHTGLSPLHVCCWSSHEDILKLLLEAHAEVNVMDVSGCVALARSRW
jgi:ankyrin repeat protein